MQKKRPADAKKGDIIQFAGCVVKQVQPAWGEHAAKLVQSGATT
jgi:hypothetical protein